ncbi:GTPase HflX [Candidatus Villigracilis proximus]|uniref:GTPase HflX n=1 Tax=Candidatus Villigracilis proximus TaxID=3140683 RepID=UPI0031E5746B
MRYRAQRKRSRIPTVALVGYTNAGKSTLLNQISKSEVYVADQLFATLDPTTRRVQLPGDDLALITDTVGFIQKLPTSLIAAFHATLEEIAEADLLLHIVDISHPNALNQYQPVQETLAEIDASHIPMITALNKADLLNRPENAREVLKSFSKAVSISALQGTGVKDLLHLIREELYESYSPIHVRLPYQQGALISLFHELGQVERVEHERGGVVMQEDSRQAAGSIYPVACQTAQEAEETGRICSGGGIMSKFLDHMSEFLAHRKGLLPIIGLIMIVINLGPSLVLPGGFLATTNLFLHIGLLIAIFGLMLSWAL